MRPQSPGRTSLSDEGELVDPLSIPLEPLVDNKKYAPDNEDDLDDDLDDDEGSRALLGSEERTRGRERILEVATGLWPQVKGIVIESAPTLLLTTIGLLFTGGLLEQVSHWRAMREVDQLIMIIPVVLNLKGNLEMNLSARLGTAANVGELDDPKTRRSMITGNLTLLQVQAAVVSFIAAGVSLVLGLIVPRMKGSQVQLVSARHRPARPLPTEGRKSGFAEFIMVSATAMTAASLSSLVLGSFMCFLIVVCRRFGRDPDNIAPPVASCLGDLVTLLFVGLSSTALIFFIRTPLPLVVCLVIAGIASTCFVLTRRNEHVRDLIKEGWSPLLGAMVISSCTGIVLDLFVTRYEGFALLAVVISGLPGSVGSIFVSRLSTSLHAAALPSTPSRPYREPSPFVVMMTLIIITIPVEIIFLAILRGLGWLHLPFVFVAFSVVFFCVAVTSSLVIARALTNFLWKRKYDPDMYALPIHSALMDLIGQLLLVLCFELVTLLGGVVRSPS